MTGKRPRRGFTLAALAAVAWPLGPAAVASPSGQVQPALRKVWQVVFLSPTPLERDEARAAAVAAFHDGMRERGLRLGRDYQFRVLSVDGDNARYPVRVAQALAEGVDLFVVPGNTGARAAKQSAGHVPVVFVGVGNPVEMGLVDSLAQPGGQITGRTAITQELDAKRLELLREMVPHLNRLAVLAVRRAGPASGPSHSGQARGLQILLAATRELGIRMEVFSVASSGEVEPELNRLLASRPQAAIVFDQSILFPFRRRLVEQLNRAGVPTMFQSRGWAERGGLMAYGAAYLEEHRLLAGHVERIMRGTPAGEIPVEQATKIELLINLNAAKALGLRVPQGLMLRADEVIR